MKQKFTKDEQAAYVRQKAKDIAAARLKEMAAMKNTPIECMPTPMLDEYVIRNFSDGLNKREMATLIHTARSAAQWARDHSVTYTEHDKILRRQRKERLKFLENKVKETIRNSAPKEHIIDMDL